VQRQSEDVSPYLLQRRRSVAEVLMERKRSAVAVVAMAAPAETAPGEPTMGPAQDRS